MKTNVKIYNSGNKDTKVAFSWGNKIWIKLYKDWNCYETGIFHTISYLVNDGTMWELTYTKPAPSSMWFPPGTIVRPMWKNLVNADDSSDIFAIASEFSWYTFSHWRINWQDVLDTHMYIITQDTTVVAVFAAIPTATIYLWDNEWWYFVDMERTKITQLTVDDTALRISVTWNWVSLLNYVNWLWVQVASLVILDPDVMIDTYSPMWYNVQVPTSWTSTVDFPSAWFLPEWSLNWWMFGLYLPVANVITLTSSSWVKYREYSSQQFIDEIDCSSGAYFNFYPDSSGYPRFMIDNGSAYNITAEYDTSIYNLSSLLIDKTEYIWQASGPFNVNFVAWPHTIEFEVSEPVWGIKKLDSSATANISTNIIWDASNCFWVRNSNINNYVYALYNSKQDIYLCVDFYYTSGDYQFRAFVVNELWYLQWVSLCRTDSKISSWNFWALSAVFRDWDSQQLQQFLSSCGFVSTDEFCNYIMSNYF